MCFDNGLFFKDKYRLAVKNLFPSILSCSSKTRQSMNMSTSASTKEQLSTGHVLVAVNGCDIAISSSRICFRMVMKKFHKLDFSIKGLVLLLFILRKMKFNVVSTKENLVTC